jgi:hypothetical protein
LNDYTFLNNVCQRWLEANQIEVNSYSILVLTQLIEKEPSYKEKILPILNEPAPPDCKNRLLFRIKQHNKAEELCKKLIEIIDRKLSAEEDFNDLC